MTQPTLSHLNEAGEAHMVDVGDKPVQRRTAIAGGRLSCARTTIQALKDQALPKGDVLAVARIAGIQAAKSTSMLIPLCHPLPLDKISVDFLVKEDFIDITCMAATSAKTGVEMEALTAASVAALTLYDMLKAIDKEMVIGEIRVLSKVKQ
jgi:cyclic pyranopterin monophosphate synthase